MQTHQHDLPGTFKMLGNIVINRGCQGLLPPILKNNLEAARRRLIAHPQRVYGKGRIMSNTGRNPVSCNQIDIHGHLTPNPGESCDPLRVKIVQIDYQILNQTGKSPLIKHRKCPFLLILTKRSTSLRAGCATICQFGNGPSQIGPRPVFPGQRQGRQRVNTAALHEAAQLGQTRCRP